MNPGTGKYEFCWNVAPGLAPVPAAVAHPCEHRRSTGHSSGAKGLITPILVGPAGQDQRDRGIITD